MSKQYKTHKDGSNIAKNVAWTIGAIMFSVAMGFLIWFILITMGVVQDLNFNFTG